MSKRLQQPRPHARKREFAKTCGSTRFGGRFTPAGLVLGASHFGLFEIGRARMAGFDDRPVTFHWLYMWLKPRCSHLALFGHVSSSIILHVTTSGMPILSLASRRSAAQYLSIVSYACQFYKVVLCLRGEGKY